MPNYDASEFAEPTPIGMGSEPFSDDEIDKLDEKLHKLEPIIAASQFRSYEELAVKFTKKTGIAVSTNPDSDIVASDSYDDEEEEKPAPKAERTKSKERTTTKKSEPAPKVEEEVDEFDEDDDAAFFKSLE